MRRGWLVMLVGCGLLMGCEDGFFRATGAVASQGGELETWRVKPMACIRDERGGFTLLWEDTVWREVDPADPRRLLLTDAPRELRLERQGAGWVGWLRTVKTKRTGATRLDAGVCKVLRVETEERAGKIAGARDSLRGQVQMDCEVRGSRVSADTRFWNCEY